LLQSPLPRLQDLRPPFPHLLQRPSRPFSPRPQLARLQFQFVRRGQTQQRVILLHLQQSVLRLQLLFMQDQRALRQWARSFRQGQERTLLLLTGDQARRRECDQPLHRDRVVHLAPLGLEVRRLGIRNGLVVDAPGNH